jgi:hypothetical protein
LTRLAPKIGEKSAKNHAKIVSSQNTLARYRVTNASDTMAQQHPREFLAEAEALAALPVRLTGAGIAAADQGRAVQRDLMADAERRATVNRASAAPHAAELLALLMAFLEAHDARTVANCSHLRDAFDLTTPLVIDLTTSWMACGCDEQISHPREDDGLCNLCAQPPRKGTLYEAQLTVGPMHTFRADLCDECWDWTRPLYEDSHADAS